MHHKTDRDFKVSVFFKLLIVVQFPQQLYGAPCPSACWCEYNSVNCNDKILTEIPNDLPKDTVYLNMNNNRLRVLDLTLLSKLPKLQFLTLRNNQIMRVNTANFKLTNLKTLDLHGNCLRILKKAPFSMIPNLVNLDLSKNSLRSAEGLFKNLSHLIILSLSDNSLTGFSNDVFLDTVRLEKLDLKDNKMKILDFNAFAHLKRLSALQLTRNYISEITVSSQKNTNLNILDLSQCRLADIPSNLPSSLEYLNIGSNRLTFITKASLENYGRLRMLVLDHNQISIIESQSFLHLERLNDLDLSDNSLPSFPDFFPKSLRYVNFDRNNISTLSFPSFSRIPYLNSLSLRNNRITELNRKSFRNLRSLRFLYMDGNPLKILADNDLSEQQELEVLSLNACPLERIAFRPFIKLKKLKELHLAFINNRLSFNSVVLEELPNLEKLNLQGSPALISSIINTSRNLAPLQYKIKVFNIMNGYLTYLPSHLKDYLWNARKIKLAGNPLHCDTNLKWLHDWIKEEPHKFPQKDLITCKSPKNIQGISINSLSEGYFQSIPSFSSQPAATVFTPYSKVPAPIIVSQEIIQDLDYADDLINYPVSGPERDTNCLGENAEEPRTDTDIKTEIFKYTYTVNAIEADASSIPPRQQSTSERSSTPCADCDADINMENNRLGELPQKSSTTKINDGKREEIQEDNRSSESGNTIASVTAYNNRPSEQTAWKDISSTKVWPDKNNLARSDTSNEIITNLVTVTPFRHRDDIKYTGTNQKVNSFARTDFPTTVNGRSTLARDNLLSDLNNNIDNNNSNDDIDEKSADNPNIVKGERDPPYYLKVAAIIASSWAGLLTVLTGSLLFLLRRFSRKKKKEREIIPNDTTENC